MKKIIFCAALAINSLFSPQTFIQAYADRANQVSQSSINSSLQQFIGFGVKTTGSTANNNALNWLKNTYQNMGYTAAQIQEDPFTFGSFGSSKNLVVTKTGTLYPNTFVIICGHFDTINGPGANDNGSGTSVILEAARILRDVPTEYSIKFIHFSGEEQGLLGSTHYVNNVVNATWPKMNIRVVFNLDQVGGVAGANNNSVYCDVDQSAPATNNAASQAMASQLATCTALYSPLQTIFGPAYASDYVPFENNGEVITGFYEVNHGNVAHTPNDTFANMDPVYVFNITKAAVGALQHFAIASASLSTNELNSATNSIEVFPNPATNHFNISYGKENIRNFEVELLNAEGRIMLKTKDTNTISVENFPAGTYICKITADGETAVRKIIVKK